VAGALTFEAESASGDISSLAQVVDLHAGRAARQYIDLYKSEARREATESVKKNIRGADGDCKG
jgi:hypothetical protein